VLRIVRVDKPVPGLKDVLLRVRAAAAVTMSNIGIRSGRVTPFPFVPFRLMIGLTRPRGVYTHRPDSGGDSRRGYVFLCPKA
ncbi:MAG: hypothetical protein ACLFSV_13470, partial [Alkalispirochaeta sp.]